MSLKRCMLVGLLTITVALEIWMYACIKANVNQGSITRPSPKLQDHWTFHEFETKSLNPIKEKDAKIEKALATKTKSTRTSFKVVGELKLSGIRKSIYESEWIRIFPNLKPMVKVVDDKHLYSITNAKHTSIKLLNSDDLQVGGKLKAIITSYNGAGERKTYGGDFFAVILRRPGSNFDGVTCDILDQMNGNYSVFCILPWEGAAIVEARLIHPSEMIYQLMKKYSSERQVGIHQNTTMVNSKNQTETTICTVGFPDKKPTELCDYTNPTHGEKRTCLRPPSGECSKITLQHKVIDKNDFEFPLRLRYCQRNHNYYVTITGSNQKLVIAPPSDKTIEHYFVGNLSDYSPDPMTPSGWLVKGKWTSIKTHRKFILDSKTFRKCGSNKRLYFFGDSTARNMYEYFIKMLKIVDFGRDNTKAKSQGRDASSQELNMTIQYRSHGPPLNNYGPENSRPYMSDSIDAIPGGRGATVLIFTIGYHFHFIGADVYLKRLKIIRNAIMSLISRAPGTRVIVKGLHFHLDDGFPRSTWLTYRFIVLLRHEFRDVEGVVFMENWDFTLLCNNAGMHPVESIFLGTIKILLPYLC